MRESQCKPTPTKRLYRLPDNSTTSDEDAYVAAWRSLAKAVCVAIGPGWRTIGFDPNLLMTLSRIEAWTHEMGAALKPPGADTYGEGMRDAKAQVARMLSGGK